MGGWIQGIIKLLPIYQSEQICFLIYCLFLTKFANSDFVKECFEPEILRKVFFPVQFESCYSFWGYWRIYQWAFESMQLFKTKYFFVVLHSAVCLQFQQKYLFVYIFCFTQNAFISTCRKSTQRTIFQNSIVILCIRIIVWFFRKKLISRIFFIKGYNVLCFCC